MGTANRASIFLRPIELQEILDLIKSICLRKAKGYDGITTKENLERSYRTQLHLNAFKCDLFE